MKIKKPLSGIFSPYHEKESTIKELNIKKMLPNWYNDYKKLVDESIDIYLSDYFTSEENTGLDTIKKSTLYACNGGKRIRSILAIEFYLLISGINFKDLNNNSDIIKFCIAIELLHAYSLVHDDLPSMDNDVLRRGKETVWKKYGESNAILVGDLLNTLSFELLSDIGNISIIKHFAKSVGFKGMVGGQTLDLYYEANSKKLDLDNLIEIHNKKTGALIEFSILGGLILGNLKLPVNKKQKKNSLENYIIFGKQIGLAFQVKDDLLDVEGTIEETGKSIGDSESKGFVYFLGLYETKKYLNDLINNSRKSVSALGSEKLNFIVDYIGNRKS